MLTKEEELELKNCFIKLYENKKEGKIDCVNYDWEVNKRIRELADKQFPMEELKKELELINEKRKPKEEPKVESEEDLVKKLIERLEPSVEEWKTEERGGYNSPWDIGIDVQERQIIVNRLKRTLDTPQNAP